MPAYFKIEDGLTLSKGRHSQDTTKHALVVAIEDTSQASEQGDAEDFEILDQSARATGAHEGFTSHDDQSKMK
jgi:hypothetical protein